MVILTVLCFLPFSHFSVPGLPTSSSFLVSLEVCGNRLSEITFINIFATSFKNFEILERQDFQISSYQVDHIYPDHTVSRCPLVWSFPKTFITLAVQTSGLHASRTLDPPKASFNLGVTFASWHPKIWISVIESRHSYVVLNLLLLYLCKSLSHLVLPPWQN